MSEKVNKSTLMRAFNSHFFEMLDDIISIFPENRDISSAKNSFELLKSSNPSIIVKVWFSNIYMKYKEVIDAGDITFFFAKDYSEDLNALSNAGSIMTIIDKLRDPVRTMSETNKEHIAEYIKNLSKISELYNASM
jgi:hypothetical protein